MAFFKRNKFKFFEDNFAQSRIPMFMTLSKYYQKENIDGVEQNYGSVIYNHIRKALVFNIERKNFDINSKKKGYYLYEI